MPLVKIEVAQEVFGLNCKDKSFFYPYLKRKRAFLTDKEPNFVINFYKNNGVKNLFSISLRKIKDNLVIDANNPKKLESGFKRGHLQMKIEKCLGLENHLRVVLSYYLFQKNGFLLHASSVVHNNKAYVFTGPSGVGKSTIARLSSDKLVLSDDLVAIRKIDNNFCAFPTPFGLQSKNVFQQSFPIRGIYLLGHAKETICEKISIKNAFSRVISNIVLMGAESKHIPAEKILDNCYNLLKTISCYDFRFAIEKDIWRHLYV